MTKKSFLKNRKGSILEPLILIPVVLMAVYFFGMRTDYQSVRTNALNDFRVAARAMALSTSEYSGIDNFQASLSSSSFGKEGLKASINSNAKYYDSDDFRSGYAGIANTRNYNVNKMASIVSRYIVFYDCSHIFESLYGVPKEKYTCNIYAFYLDTGDSEGGPLTSATVGGKPMKLKSIISSEKGKLTLPYWNEYSQAASPDSNWSGSGITFVKLKQVNEKLLFSSKPAGATRDSELSVWQKGMQIEINYVVKSHVIGEDNAFQMIDGQRVSLNLVGGKSLITTRVTIQ